MRAESWMARGRLGRCGLDSEKTGDDLKSSGGHRNTRRGGPWPPARLNFVHAQNSRTGRCWWPCIQSNAAQPRLLRVPAFCAHRSPAQLPASPKLDLGIGASLPLAVAHPDHAPTARKLFPVGDPQKQQGLGLTTAHFRGSQSKQEAHTRKPPPKCPHHAVSGILRSSNACCVGSLPTEGRCPVPSASAVHVECWFAWSSL